MQDGAKEVWGPRQGRKVRFVRGAWKIAAARGREREEQE